MLRLEDLAPCSARLRCVTSSKHLSLSELHIYNLEITVSDLLTLYHCLQIQVRLARDLQKCHCQSSGNI